MIVANDIRYAYDVVWRGCDKDAIPQLHNRRLFAFADSGVPDGSKFWVSYVMLISSQM